MSRALSLAGFQLILIGRIWVIPEDGPGGPFWVERQGDQPLPSDRHYCGCWRCSLNQGNELKNSMQAAVDDGFRAFIEIAAKTKAPAEWNKRRLRRFMIAVSQREFDLFPAERISRPLLRGPHTR
jgi:hypothetical protein